MQQRRAASHHFTRLGAGLMGCLLFLVGMPSASAQDADASIDESQMLVERYAPLLRVKSQVDECDPDGEPYSPVSVDSVLANDEIALRQRGTGDPVVEWGPGAADLDGLGEGFFLDFPGSALEPGCVYERDSRRYTGDASPVIYAHIVQPEGDSGKLVVQYWFYWYFNDWNNKHESDWEGISLLFDAGSVAEALTENPVEVGYSQHEGGERAGWDDDKLTRVGDRPVVYSSAGSHASYFDSAVYLGRGASEGFGCDDTTGPSDELDPLVVLLPDDSSGDGDEFAWLGFEGRWGERQSGPFNGPTGPAQKDRWLDPMPWFDDLRDSSVLIPAGDTQAASLVGAFCGVVEAGSRSLIQFQLSPATVMLMLVVCAIAAYWVATRTDWSVTSPVPIRQRRRAGQVFRTSLRVYAATPAAFVLLGGVYIPAAAIVAGIVIAAEWVPVLGAFLELGTDSGGTNLFAALLLGTLPNIAAAVIVSAAVADYLSEGAGGISGAMRSLGRTWERRGVLAATFVRSYGIVVGLLVTVVGSPWALRQLVRYQFAPQAIVDGAPSPRTSLRRSSDLVTGRWWHTAIVLACCNAAVFAAATGTSLAMLVLFTSIPLWVFSVLISVIYALAVPAAAIAMTFLYGDATLAGEGGIGGELDRSGDTVGS